MGLNKKGIRLLADDLVAHQKRYNQSTFGSIEECGTVCCLDGFCRIREVGMRAFNKWVKLSKSGKPPIGDYETGSAGIKQLGIRNDVSFPIIFASIYNWPEDLNWEYRSDGPRWRVIAALKALQRLLPDGSIDPDPDAVHTKLPQLTKMLKEKKKTK